MMQTQLSTTTSYEPSFARRGMTLIEVLFTIGVVGVLFVGIYGIFQVSIEVVSNSKARAGALALAIERMEQLRSLPYEQVGTAGGIPAGSIPQSESVTLNQTEYTRRTFISYVDDPADGSGALDDNGITADYKLVKIEMQWSVRGSVRTYFQVSSIVPRGIESLTGGGTLRIQVYDALSQPVTGATVRVLNTTGTSTIDVTTYTNAQGFVTFPGTPVGAGYQILVGKSGYSGAQTYAATAGNPNPTPGHLSVADGQTTTGTFFIDYLAALSVQTLKPIEETTWEEEFSDVSGIAATASTTVLSGGLMLEANGSDYWPAGSARLEPIAPDYLVRWSEALWTATTPAGTEVRTRIYYDQGGTPTLIPEGVLPGNAAGFTVSPIDLSAVATSTYPSLSLDFSLSSSDPAATPDVRVASVLYDRGPVPIPNIPFALTGSKTIGATSAGAAIYKFDSALSTDATGAFSTSTMEWDSYELGFDDTATGYDIAEACVPLPVTLAPQGTQNLKLYLVPDSPHSALIAIKDSVTGAFIEGAGVQITRSGVDVTSQTGACGQAFFSGLSSGTVTGGNAYTLTVSKTGYQSVNLTEVDITDAMSLTVTLTPQ